ncbi:MAG TPA: hypothetical protein VF384_14305 [Planctomycetota bacterium]
MRRREQMAALLARREVEGLSLRALSEESGIPFGTLSWWSWRLRQESERTRSTATPFLEVVSTDRQSDGEVVVRLGNGLEVNVQAGTDARWLRDLVAALRSC